MKTVSRNERELHLRLSAPEAESLLRGPRTDDCLALQLALKELVVREALAMVTATEPCRIGPARRINLLTRGRTFNAVTDRCLQAVLGVYGGARPAEEAVDLNTYIGAMQRKMSTNSTPNGAWSAFKETLREQTADLGRPEEIVGADGSRGVPINALTAAVLRRYPDSGWHWARTRGYVYSVVLASLVDRGFYTAEQYRRLELFNATQWLPTPAGLEARRKIGERLAAGGLSGRGRASPGIASELRVRASFLGNSDIVDAVFSSIDRGVRSGWSDVYGGD